MNSTKKSPKKNGGLSSRKGEAEAPKKEAAGLVPEKKGNGNFQKEEPKVQDVIQKISAEVGQPEKKRRGRAPSEGEPLRRVLIFLGTKELAALKAEVGDRAMSTKIREIVKAYLAK